ncbi:MAG: CDP-alcohol phosphatidyltransferase family protein [Mariniphaga sp.]
MFGFEREKHLNVPNVLSFYRLISFPFVLFFILTNRESVFVILLIINLITDILDGAVSRIFNLCTEFGAKLDSLADDGTIILAILGIVYFKLEEFAPYFSSFLIFLIIYFLTMVISLIKFRRFPGMHLYSAKIGAYLQGLFFFILFVFDFNSIFYYIVIVWGIISLIENIIIMLLESEMRSDFKGLYWVLKNR